MVGLDNIGDVVQKGEGSKDEVGDADQGREQTWDEVGEASQDAPAPGTTSGTLGWIILAMLSRRGDDAKDEVGDAGQGRDEAGDEVGEASLDAPAPGTKWGRALDNALDAAQQVDRCGGRGWRCWPGEG